MLNIKRKLMIKGNTLLNFIQLDAEEKEMVRVWRNTGEIRRNMYFDHIIKRKEHFSFLEGLKQDQKNLNWIVKIKESEYVGVISINRIDKINKHAYLGIYTNPYSNLEGKGKVLIECLKNVAFNILKLHTLKLEVIETNSHAVGFYLKMGFKKEGLLKEYVYRNGQWLDVVIMGISSKGNKS